MLSITQPAVAPIQPPLSATFARMAQLSSYLKADIADTVPATAISPQVLFDPRGNYLTEQIEQTQQRLRTQARAVVGSSILQAYQWPLISTLLACYLLERRIPDLRIENCLLGYQQGAVTGLFLRRGTCFVLANDPAAKHPDARVLADLPTMQLLLRTSIETHFGQVIEWICQGVGCQPRGLWLNVADRCASTMLWLMQLQNPNTPVEVLEQAVNMLIKVPGSPLTNRQIGLITLQHGERTATFLQRASCCYFYKQDGGEYCSTCPHRTAEDRRERLQQYLANQHES
ncbi:MAG: IucA/IucC family C-terminal-domain containing protein [Roseiflexaceae bacterium]